eukprot:Em0009g78a
MSSQGAQGAEYSGSVLSKAKNTSWVWKHYVLDRKPSEKEKFPPARCKLCDKVVTRARGNTSNMNRHIWDKHSVECSLDRETSKRLSAAEAEIPCPISLSEEDVNCADDLLVNAMVWGLLPAYEMENPFLRLFVNKLSKGGYALPHRTKLTKMIAKKYEETKEVLKNSIEQASSVAITTDGATMKNSGDSYVAITGHWITPAWKLMSAVLGVKISDESHTGEAILALIKNVTQKDFFLADRLDAVTTDNGTNFVRAVDLMLSQNITEEHVRCACHTLQLSIKNALEFIKPVAELIDLFKRIVNTISGSPVLLKALRDKQNNPNLAFQFESQHDEAQSIDEEDGYDDSIAQDELQTSIEVGIDDSLMNCEYLHWGRTKKLIKDIVTRWNSTYDMLQRALELKEAIDFVLIDTGRHDICPSYEHWRSALMLCNFLKPFAVVTDILQGEKYPTLGCVSRYVSYLQQGLKLPSPPASWNLNDSLWAEQGVVSEVRDFILADMDRRWNATNPLLLMGSITHPGHKSLSWLPPNQRQIGVDQLRLEMNNVSGLAMGVPHVEAHGSEIHVTKQPRLTLSQQAKSLFSFGKSPPESVDSEQQLGDELQRYLNEPEIDHLSADPLACSADWARCAAVQRFTGAGKARGNARRKLLSNTIDTADLPRTPRLPTPQNTGVTHVDNTLKNNVQLTWTAPPKGTGEVVLSYAVVTQNNGSINTFYATLTSPTIAELDSHGVSGYDFEEYTFPCCGKTFFINNSCEFDEYKTKKNVSSEKCVVDSKNGNG